MKRLRWVVLALLFTASVINYIDRQSLSILARTIQDDIHMSDLGYAHVVQMFLFAYMLSFLVVGWVTDRLGTRMSAVLFIGWWSIANMCTGMVESVRGLALTRFFLGAGESGLYTVAPKIVGQMFPATERGLAVGIYSAGATIGATIAPPLIVFITANYGWRKVFVAGGLLGLVWVLPWLWATSSAKSAATEVPVPKARVVRRPGAWWRDILFCREAMLLLAVRIITDPVWQFLLYWFPKYVSDTRGLSLAQVGKSLWVVYLAADIGGVGAGFIAGRLVRRGLRPGDACKWVMLVCAMIVPLCAMVPHVSSRAMLMTIVAIVALATFAFMISVAAIAVEVLPQERFGTTWGIVSAGSGFGGIIFTSVVGHLVTSFSYTPVFMLMACMHPAAMFLVWQAAKGSREKVPEVRGFSPIVSQLEPAAS